MNRWIVLAVALTIAGLLIISGKRLPLMSKGTIKVALSGILPKGTLAPENISTIPLYHLHYNLWDTLIAPGNNAGIAKSFKISQDRKTYTFSIDERAKFSNGRSITAEDVKFSLERLIGKEENGHINAKSTVKAIRSLRPNQIAIILHKPTPSFAFLLSTPEFGIVPSEAVKSDGSLDLSITSGAYTVERINQAGGTISLKRNPLFLRHAEKSAETVELHFLPAIEIDSFKETLSLGFDFIELQHPEIDSLIPLAEAADLEFKTTAPSMSIFLLANTKELSPGSAQTIAAAFQGHFLFQSTRNLELRSHQLLPAKTFGSLKAAEIPEIAPREPSIRIPKEIVIKASRTTGPVIEEIKRVFAEVGSTVRLISRESKDSYHYQLRTQGMNTEFPEIELHLAMASPYANIKATAEDKKLLEAATYEPDDVKRSEMIKAICRNLLVSGEVIPLTTRSYVHIYNPKTIDLNGITNYDGDVPLYRLRIAP